MASQTPRVCLIGPESTGKTTLAAELAEHYGTVWVPEFARQYALEAARPLTAGDVEAIARGVIAEEERIAAGATGLLILDTDLVSTMVYADLYYGGVPAWIADEARRRMADLYLLFDIDVPFEGDAARDAAADRQVHMAAFRNTLETLGADWCVIEGTRDRRRSRAIEAIDRYAAR